MVGNLFNFAMTLPPMLNTPAPVKSKKKAAATNAFRKSRYKGNVWSIKEEKTPKIIVIDDEFIN